MPRGDESAPSERTAAIAELREAAQRARNHAAMILDAEAAVKLRQYAEELEQRAAALEAELDS